MLRDEVLPTAVRCRPLLLLSIQHLMSLHGSLLLKLCPSVCPYPCPLRPLYVFLHACILLKYRRPCDRCPLMCASVFSPCVYLELPLSMFFEAFSRRLRSLAYFVYLPILIHPPPLPPSFSRTGVLAMTVVENSPSCSGITPSWCSSCYSWACSRCSWPCPGYSLASSPTSRQTRHVNLNASIHDGQWKGRNI